MRTGSKGGKGAMAKSGRKANQGGAHKGGIASAAKADLKAPPVSPNRKSVKAATRMMQDPKS